MHLPITSSLRKVVGFALLAAMTFAAAPAASAPAVQTSSRSELVAAAQKAGRSGPAPLGRQRTQVPEDRYAMAGGCYSVRDATGPGYLGRTADGGVTLTRDAEPVHFQATRLGSYLLYGSDEDFVAATDGEVGKGAKTVTQSSVGGAVGGLTIETTDRVAEDVSRGPAGTASGRGAALEMADEPSELADWQVEQRKDRSFTFVLPSIDRALGVDEDGELALVAPDAAAGFRLLLTDGCATFPEIDPGVEGAIVGGETPYSEVSGYLEAHLHLMAFEFLGGRARCGRPWHPYGVEYALKGCSEHEMAGGRAAVLETVLSGRDPVAGHDTNAGWPTFTDWPKHGSLTYEQVYYTWMERAWRGGLRMFVNLLVDNVQLCNLYPYKSHGCDEMETVRLEAQRTFELQDYIDAQHGGPGRGWFRIVDNPFEARRIMNEGKLAVVLGIEVSRLFDCRYLAATATSTCTAEQIDQRLDAVYDMGVRQMELVNKFDNALSGVTGDSAQQGIIVNGGNFLETGGFWQMRTCAEPEEEGHAHAHDKQQYNFHDESGAPDEITGRDSLVGILLQELGGSGAAPAYGPGPHCNDLGLSELGEHLIRRMIDKGMIFDPDHMSAVARDQAMDVIEQTGYSGVVSSHGWADDTIYPRVIAAGGVVTPHAGSSTSFVGKYRKHRSWADDRYYYGIGFGADTNGFSNQGGPRGANAETPVTYPFTGFGGVTVDRNVTGERTWDINTDGVAHYGMYPDWVQDVANLLGDDREQFLTDMSRGPEAYLQMWERAIGVAPDTCRSDVANNDGYAAVREGMTPEQVLLAAGQPAQRDGNTFVYCVDGGTATVTFGADGTVQGATAPGGMKPDKPGKGKGTGKPVASAEQDAVAPPETGHDHAGHDHDPVELASATSAGQTGKSIALIAFIALFVITQLRAGRGRSSTR